MAGSFLTEKQIESLLRDEVRMIAMPDGSKRAVRQMNLTWGWVDEILNFLPDLTMEVISTFALDLHQKCRFTFDEAFRTVVMVIEGDYAKKIKESLGRDIEHIRARLKSYENIAKHQFNLASASPRHNQT